MAFDPSTAKLDESETVTVKKKKNSSKFDPSTIVEEEVEVAPEQTSEATPESVPEKTGLLHPIATAKANVKGFIGDVKSFRENLSKESQAIENEPNPYMGMLKTAGGSARLATQVMAEPFVLAGRGVANTFPGATKTLGNIGRAVGQSVLSQPVTGITPSYAQTYNQSGTSLGDVLAEAGRVKQGIKQKYPVAADVAKEAGSLVNYATMVVPYRPFAAGGEEILKAGTNQAGKLVESAGKWGEEKLISANIAKGELKKHAGGASESATEGLKKVVDEITVFGLDSPLGIRKSQKKATERLAVENQNYDRNLQRFTADPKNVVSAVDVGKIIDDIKVDIAGRGKIADQIGVGLPEDIAKATRVLDGIKEDLSARGMSGLMLTHELPKVKQVISRDVNAFAKGAVPTPDDIVKRNIGKVTYLKVMDELNNKLAQAGFTEFKQQGQNIKTLIGLTDILDNAGLSDEKWTPARITNMLVKMSIGTGVGAAGGGVAGGVAGLVGGLALDKAVGAVPSLALKLGRVMQGKKTIGQVVPELTAAEKAARARNLSVVSKSIPGVVYTPKQFSGQSTPWNLPKPAAAQSLAGVSPAAPAAKKVARKSAPKKSVQKPPAQQSVPATPTLAEKIAEFNDVETTLINLQDSDYFKSPLRKKHNDLNHDIFLEMNKNNIQDKPENLSESMWNHYYKHFRPGSKEPLSMTKKSTKKGAK
jgi:hypothetical protein